MKPDVRRMNTMLSKLYEKFVKDRTVGYWLALGAAIALLITDIIFIATDFGDRTFSLVTFLLILAGVAIEIVYVVLDMKVLDFLPVLSCVCYGVALGQHWNLGLATLSDVWNGVVFVGGNSTAALAFGIVFAVCTVAAIVSCFLKQKKEN